MVYSFLSIYSDHLWDCGFHTLDVSTLEEQLLESQMTTYRDPFTLEEAMREIRATRKTVESQNKEIERLRLDAERYRFLVNEDNYDGWYPSYYDGYGKDRHEFVFCSSITDIDKAIDKAIDAAMGRHK